MKKLTTLIVIALVLSIVPLSTPSEAGGPWPPELISPAPDADVSQNPRFCAKYSDPDGDNGSVNFELWGGGEPGTHQSGWLTAQNGATVCWTISAPLLCGASYEWQARAMDVHGEQAASSGRRIKVQCTNPPAASCTFGGMTVTPPPIQTIGVNVTISANATCTNGVRELRFFVGGQHIGTTQGSSGSVVWNTSGWGANNHIIEVRAVDNQAGHLKSISQGYTLRPSGNPAVDEPAPDQPGGLPAFDGGDPPLAPGQQPPAGYTAPVCPSLPAISPGDIVVVSNAITANLNVRARPGTDKTVMFTVKPYDYLTIIAGPLCASGYWWYEIGIEGRSGWVVVNGLGQEQPSLIQNGQPMPGPPAVVAPGTANQPNQAAQPAPVIQANVKANVDGSTYRGWPFPPQAGSVQVTVDKLRIRAGPGTNRTQLGYVSRDEYYPVLERDGEWGKIRTASGLEGWIFLGRGYTTSATGPALPPPVAQEVTVICDGQVITVTDWNPDTQTTAQGTNCVAYVYPQEGEEYAGWTTPRYAVDYIQVTASNLNLRSGPGEAYSILGKVVNSHYYVLLETNGPWGKIRTVNLTEAWVYLDGFANIFLDPNPEPVLDELPYEGFDTDLFMFLTDCAKLGLEWASGALRDYPTYGWTSVFNIPPDSFAECFNSGIDYISPKFNAWIEQITQNE